MPEGERKGDVTPGFGPAPPRGLGAAEGRLGGSVVVQTRGERPGAPGAAERILEGDRERGAGQGPSRRRRTRAGRGRREPAADRGHPLVGHRGRVSRAVHAAPVHPWGGGRSGEVSSGLSLRGEAPPPNLHPPT